MIDLDRKSEEIAREAYILSLKLHINTILGPQLRNSYNNRVLPKYVAAHGKQPANRHVVRKEMLKEKTFKFWASLSVSSQELMWDGIGDEIYRQLPELNKRAKIYKPKGSLRIDNNFCPPSYVSDVHIHGQPGGYSLNFSNDDVTAGVYCEGAHRIYSKGQGNKAAGFQVMDTLLNNLKKQYPNLKPKRVLDIGCNIGRTTVSIKRKFPDANVYGIDIGPGIVRYAHARAESLNYELHFALQNGEKTDYEDGFFDLIVSGTLLHETSYKAMYNIFNECYRLLSKDGVMAHLEIALRNKDLEHDVFYQWYRDWSTHYNAEPFWGKFHDMDVVDPIIKGGFSSNKSWEKYFKTPEGPEWWACGGQK